MTDDEMRQELRLLRLRMLAINFLARDMETYIGDEALHQIVELSDPETNVYGWLADPPANH